MGPALETDIGCRGLDIQTSVYIYDQTPSTMTSFAVCASGEVHFSRSAIAANNATQNKQLQYAGEALKKNGVALALDAASLGVDAFGPEAQYAKLGIGLGLSTASMINSAANHDMTGTGLEMASYLKAPTELAATSAGWGWAKWIPFAGAGRWPGHELWGKQGIR